MFIAMSSQHCQLRQNNCSGQRVKNKSNAKQYGKSEMTSLEKVSIATHNKLLTVFTQFLTGACNVHIFEGVVTKVVRVQVPL